MPLHNYLSLISSLYWIWSNEDKNALKKLKELNFASYCGGKCNRCTFTIRKNGNTVHTDILVSSQLCNLFYVKLAFFQPDCDHSIRRSETQVLHAFQKGSQVREWRVVLLALCENRSSHQRTIPSPTDVKRESLLGSMGRTCRQSGSFSRAVLIQFTKAYRSSSAAMIIYSHQ